MSQTLSRKSTERDYVAIAEKYATDVISGAIPSCKWVRLACQRHFADLDKAKGDWPYEFSAKAALRVCRFVELQFHTKGIWASRRERLVMQPWQVFLTVSIFGWIGKEDGHRRFRRALLLVPRKNGKSAWAAAIGLYMLLHDGEFGAEVYSGATSEKQAWEVFGPARLMANRNESLKAHYGLTVNASNLHVLENGSKFEPLIGKPGDGSSPSCAIIDEYHEHDTDELLGTMQTGMGARQQPLLLVITTAGWNIAGPCYAMVQAARRLLDEIIEDDEFFALMYGIDKGDDWTLPEVLQKANPNFGVSVGDKFLLSEQRQAINDARHVTKFKTKHLNEWVNAKDVYFNVQRWMEAECSEISLEDFYGQPVRLGLDLASKVDIAALEFVFRLDVCRCPVAVSLVAKGYKFARFGWYYLPSAAVERSENEHYHVWNADGLFRVTDGEMNDQTRIRDDILWVRETFQLEEVAYDPDQARLMVSELEAVGVKCTEIIASMKNFSDPMKHIDGFIREKQIAHNGDPVFSWMLSNVVTKANHRDQVYPRKDRDENKIDGVVAHIMAMNRYLDGAEPVAISVFELIARRAVQTVAEPEQKADETVTTAATHGVFDALVVQSRTDEEILLDCLPGNSEWEAARRRFEEKLQSAWDD